MSHFIPNGLLATDVKNQTKNALKPTTESAELRKLKRKLNCTKSLKFVSLYRVY